MKVAIGQWPIGRHVAIDWRTKVVMLCGRMVVMVVVIMGMLMILAVLMKSASVVGRIRLVVCSGRWWSACLWLGHSTLVMIRKGFNVNIVYTG